jgi:hypothetical protein
MARNKQRAPISLRALVQRINRRLAADGRTLRSPRGHGNAAPLGDYFVTDDRGVVVAGVQPEKLGREIGVLRPWEEVR